MANQPSREEIVAYKKHRANGDYREAAKVLLPYKDNPKIMELIKQLKVAHQTGEVPVTKAKNQNAKNMNGFSTFINYALLVLLSVFAAMSLLGVLIGNWISILPTLLWGYLGYRTFQRIQTKTKNTERKVK